MNRITAEQLYRSLHHPQRMQLWDVRDPEDFANGHIAGSVNVPLPILRETAHKLDSDSTFCLICTNASKADSAASYLRELGFKVLVLAGGLRSWTAFGYELSDRMV